MCEDWIVEFLSSSLINLITLSSIFKIVLKIFDLKNVKLTAKIAADLCLKKFFFKKFVIFEIVLKIFNLKNVKLTTKVAVDLCLKKLFFKKFMNFWKSVKAFEAFDLKSCVKWNLNWNFESCMIWNEVWDFETCMFSIERRNSEIFLIIMNFTSCIWFFQKFASIMFSLTRFSSGLFFSLSLFTLWSEKFWRRKSLINLSIFSFFDDRSRFWF